MVAVKPCRKLRPPTGPISPAQKKPAVGTPSAVLEGGRVVVRNLEHVGAASVAGEEQRACGAVRAERLSLDAQRLAEVLVRGRGIADMQPHGLAHSDRLADRDRSRLSVGTDDRPHQEVASLVLGAVLVDDQPDQHTRRRHPPLFFWEGRDHLAEPLHRRLACELADHVGLGGRDRHLRADRARPLGDAGQHLCSPQSHRDRAVRVNLAVSHQHRAAREGGAG